ncbi:MAG: tRNA lysidine(34) synthetase TilS [Rhabdochlamydiaceae bacterium]|nr:tRNA lysidine(34) synthetase TilS [Rhabdochlamydiaceae bacterium]
MFVQEFEMPYNAPMVDTLLLSLRKFLIDHWTQGKPLLLGYSGGPDSKALLYLLLACKRFFPLDLHLIHIDHSWRDKSREEAMELQQEARSLNLEFHLFRLIPDELPKKNLEAHARSFRLQCFKKTYCEIGAQALILAHQFEDQAETVLKRLFEGAHLRHAAGMRTVSVFNEMVVWRPLLDKRKSELIDWLAKKGLRGLEDSTNWDARFLRARMRSELLPQLSQAFGKGVETNLCRFGQMASELAEYFSLKLAHCFATLNANAHEVHWDLSKYDLERIEWQYLLREWASRENIQLSLQVFDLCVGHLQKKSSAKNFPLKEGVLSLHRGILSFKRSIKCEL